MKYQVLIADGNKSSRDLLKFKVESISDGQLNVFGAYGNIEQSVGAVFIHEPDIIVLDVNIFQHDHFDIFEKLINQKIIKGKIIIIAGDNQLQFIQKSVEIGISSLLIKPFKSEDLKKSLNRIIAQVNEERAELFKTDHFITLKFNHSKLYVNQNDIIFIESNRNVCTITFTDGSSKMVNENITSISNRLLVKNLVRIDRSTIINVQHITYIDGSEYNKSCKLRLINGQDIQKSLSKIAVQRLYNSGIKLQENGGRKVKF